VLLRSYAKRTKKADTSAAGRHRSLNSRDLMICAYYRLRFVTILLRIVAQSRAVQNAAKIYLAPGRHPVISAIAPELASRFAHILTEPLPENLAALLQQLDAKLSAAQTCRRRTRIRHNQNRKTASRGGLSEIRSRATP